MGAVPETEERMGSSQLLHTSVRRRDVSSVENVLTSTKEHVERKEKDVVEERELVLFATP